MMSFRINNFLFRNVTELCSVVHVLTIHDFKPHFLLFVERRGGVYDFNGLLGCNILSLSGLDAVEELILLVFRLLYNKSTVQSATLSWWLFSDSWSKRWKRFIIIFTFELTNPLFEFFILSLIDKHLQVFEYTSIPLLAVLILFPKSNNLLLHVLKDISVDLHGLKIHLYILDCLCELLWLLDAG